MNWKFWQRKPVEEPVSPFPDVPVFTIEGLMDGNCFIKCEWPKPVSPQHAVIIARELANLMYMASTGELLSTMFQAVAVNGNQVEMDGIANNAIDMTQKAMTALAKADRDSELVVTPEDAFKVP